MATGELFKWIVSVVTLVLAIASVYTLARPIDPGKFRDNPNIARIAKLDLSHVGCYDEHLRVSILYYFYAVDAIAYQSGQLDEVTAVIHNWLKHTYDPSSIIINAVDEAYTKVLTVVDEARENKKELNFKISPEFDYKQLPSTFKYNDYIQINLLVKDLSEYLEV